MPLPPTSSTLTMAPNALAAAVLERQRLATRLRRVIRGDVLFDAASRARYSLDAGGHHCEPIGVVAPRDDTDVIAVLDLARESGVAVLARGAGTSSGAQSIASAVLLDYSKYQNQIIQFNAQTGIVEVQPGITLEQLERFASQHNRRLPCVASNPEAATLGGVLATSRDCAAWVRGIDIILADGTSEFFGPFGVNATRPMASPRTASLVSRLFELQAFGNSDINLAHVLLGSQGRLAFFRRLHLQLAPLVAAASPQLTQEQVSEAYPSETFEQIRRAFDPQEVLPPLSQAEAQASPVGQCDFKGTCRSSFSAMCPSFQATGDEQHSPRGRATILQAAEEHLHSVDVSQAMELCVSCKACKTKCPAGIDMAREKINVMAAQQAHGAKLTLAAKLIAYLPRYAAWAHRLQWLSNARNRWPWLARLGERLLGLSAQRRWPQWSGKPFTNNALAKEPTVASNTVLLWADSFHNHFESHVLADAERLLTSAGYAVQIAATPSPHDRPLCCGRTFLSQGMKTEAQAEMERSLQALRPWILAGVPVVGLEPACLNTMRDEFLWLSQGKESQALAERLSTQAFILEEFIVRELDAGRWQLPLRPATHSAWLHGHCHQKAFGQMSAIERCLQLIPELTLHSIESACCGMAGSFGLEASHLKVSMRMAEASLLPAVRNAAPDDWIVADGTSCRSQILQGSARQAHHVASVLAAHL